MRVLLAATNRCDAMVPPYPLGLACVAAGLDPSRHEVRVWDAMFEPDWQDALSGAVRAFDPEVIGLSIRNVDDQEIRDTRFLLDDAKEAAAICRRESGALLVGGGPAFSMFPRQMLAYVGLDHGVVGDGELAFADLVDRAAAGQALDGIPGVVHLADGALAGKRPTWSLPLDDLPPVSRAAPDMARYYGARGSAGFPNSATLQSKRGCPLACAYCATASIEGAGIRVRSPRLVVDEVERMVAEGFERVQFVDSVFTNPRWHARAICEEMVRRGVRASWSATVSPAFADVDTLRAMRDAGCVLVMIGNESGSAATLTGLGKSFDAAAVEQCFAACQEIGLAYNAFLLLGGPGEDRDTVRESVDLMRRWAPARVSVTVGVRLYPGCAVTRAAIAEGLLDPADDLLAPRFYLAPAVRDWIWDALEPVLAAEPTWSL